MKNKVYIVWIGWIGISAIARYYLSQSYTVYWSDMVSSELIKNLENEWVYITIWENPDIIDKDFDFVIYTEAVPEEQTEIQKAKKLWIKLQTYPQAIAHIANNKKLITIAWTHWKSTTSSLTSLVLKNSNIDFTSIVWTILKEFNNKNFYYRKNSHEDEYFILEACEYKRSFLNYKPTVWIIVNIELDHLDYYKDLKDYISAYKEYLDNIVPWWYAILNWDDENCRKLIWLRNDINYIEVFNDCFRHNWQLIPFPIIDIKIPWEHILFDAKIAYIVWHMVWINDKEIIKSLEGYSWVWRRMELIWKTVHNNILMSDYWHHPTEISLTLKAIKDNNIDKKILTIFQPHQYSRTYELLNDFKNCFTYTDKLIIPNIYKSRDTKKDIERIDTDWLIKQINHEDIINWNWLENTLKLIEKFDEENSNSIIILMGAGDVDNLRYKIKTV
jgi:UDP-N-acetylmuramate--alanine ligase